MDLRLMSDDAQRLSMRRVSPSPRVDVQRIASVVEAVDDGGTDGALEAICAAAVGSPGPIASVCAPLDCVAQTRRQLGGSGVFVLTTVSQVGGVDDPAVAASRTAEAFLAGAQEVAVAAPWRAFRAGDAGLLGDVVAACKSVTPRGGVLRAILELGELASERTVRRAALRAIAAGADFLQTTSGGQVAGAAATHAVIDEINQAPRAVGLAIGGLQSIVAAQEAVAQIDRMMGPDWLDPSTLRLPSSPLFRALFPRH